MCSRLWIGSASMPSSPSRLVTAVLDAVAQRLVVAQRPPAAGAASDLRMDTGRPALVPGV